MEPTAHQYNEAGEQPEQSPPLDDEGFQPPVVATPPTPKHWEPGPQHREAFHGVNHIVHPASPITTPSATPFGQAAGPGNPVAVVRVLSPIGIEYAFMTISLFGAAGGLTAALLSMVNGAFGFDALAFPAALLVVSLPAFAYLFLRTKKKELQQPALKLDPSKRRSTQFTQIVSFLISFFTAVALVFSVFTSLGGKSFVSLGKVALDCLVLLVIFGGILSYYWLDEHRS